MERVPNAMSQRTPTPLPVEDARLVRHPQESVIRRLRVLVIDDYPDSAASTAMLMSLLGHDCRSACTGSEGLAVAEQFHPEVILLDIGLPDLSGYEVVKQLRARNAKRPAYIVAVTGRGQPEDRARALAAGFDQHVLKPADTTTIKAILRRAEIALPGSYPS